MEAQPGPARPSRSKLVAGEQRDQARHTQRVVVQSRLAESQTRMCDPLLSDLVLVSIAFEEFRDSVLEERAEAKTNEHRPCRSLCCTSRVGQPGSRRKLSEGQPRCMTVTWSALWSAIGRASACSVIWRIIAIVVGEIQFESRGGRVR